MKIELNDNVFYSLLAACITCILCFVAFSVWQYNIKAVEYYTKGNYEEVSDVGTAIIYWRKAEQK